MSADEANTAGVDQHVDDDEKQYEDEDEDQDDENGSDSDYVGGNDANGAIEYTPDPIDLSIRHPLQHKWTMWYDTPIAQGKRASAAAWHSNLKKIMDFDTVEDFWSLFNNLATPDSLPNGSNFHLFKEGIRPAWEDPQNAVGGKWVIAVRSADTKTLNDAWINTILAMIGDAFEESSEICGAVASVRKGQNRLALWTRTGSNEILQSKIGRQWKAILNTPIVIQYQLHDEALKLKSSAKVAAYYTV